MSKKKAETPQTHEEKFVAALQAYFAKRKEWENSPDEGPPGDWFFNDLEQIIHLAAEQAVEDFGLFYWLLVDVGRRLLRSHASDGVTAYPSGGLVSVIGRIEHHLNRWDNSGDEWIFPDDAITDRKERRRNFGLLGKISAALKAFHHDGDTRLGMELLEAQPGAFV